MNAQIHSVTGESETINGKALFGGIITALAITAVLNILGIGLGIISLNTNLSGSTLGIGGYLWLLITSAIATFLGAWLSAYATQTRLRERSLGCVHGLAVWSGTAIITLLFASSTGGVLLSGAGNVFRNVVSAGAGQSSPLLTAQIDTQAFEQLQTKISDSLDQAKINPERIKSISNQAKDFLLASNEQQKSTLKQQLAETISNNSEMSQQDASQLVNDWQKTYQQFYQTGKDQLKQTAKSSSKVAGGSLIAIFIINLLTLVTAIAGATFAINKKPLAA